MRFLIDGCYGDGNLGDELLLRAMRRVIRQVDPIALIEAFSEDPNETARLHSIPSHPQCHPFGKSIYGCLAKGLLRGTLRAIQACDVFVLGGGELFRDRAGLRATWGMLYRLQLAKLLGKPTVALGVGAQRPTNWGGRQLLRSGLRHTDYVLFRDPRAYDVGAELSSSEEGLGWAPDPVFCLADHSVRTRPKDRTPRIGLAVKALPTNHPHYESVCRKYPEILATAINRSSAADQCKITLFPFAPADERIAMDITARLKRVPEIAHSTPSSVHQQIQQMDAVIAVPLHASVVAFSTGVPSLGICYDAKIARLYENLGLEQFCLAPETLDVETIVDSLRWLWTTRSHLRPNVLQQAEVAARGFEAAAQSLLKRAVAVASSPRRATSRLRLEGVE